MTSNSYYETNDYGDHLEKGDPSVQRPPLSLSTGPGIILCGTPRISNSLPLARQERMNFGLCKDARRSGARHSCPSPRRAHLLTHIATTRPTAFPRLTIAELSDIRKGFEARHPAAVLSFSRSAAQCKSENPSPYFWEVNLAKAYGDISARRILYGRGDGLLGKLTRMRICSTLRK
jgi:hypothetical protein